MPSWSFDCPFTVRLSRILFGPVGRFNRDINTSVQPGLPFISNFILLVKLLLEVAVSSGLSLLLQYFPHISKYMAPTYRQHFQFFHKTISILSYYLNAHFEHGQFKQFVNDSGQFYNILSILPVYSKKKLQTSAAGLNWNCL